MKQILLLLIVACVYIFVVKAQRPPVDSAAIANWPVVQGEALSADGTFALYLTTSFRAAWERAGEKLCVAGTDGRRQMILYRVEEAYFTGDSKYAVVRTVDDSLIFLNLTKGTRHAYGGIKWVKMPKEGNGDVAAAGLKNDQVVAFHAGNGYSDTLGIGERVEFDRSGRWLLWSHKMGSGLERWSYFDCDSRQGKAFWTGSSMGTISFEGALGRIAFLGMGRNMGNYSVWEYEMGMDSAGCQLNSTVDQRGDSIIIENGRLDFLQGMNAWVFHVRRRSGASVAKNMIVNVKVWRFNDEWGSPTGGGGNRKQPVRNFLAVGYRGSSSVVTLGKEDDWPGDPTLNLDGNCPWAVTFTLTNAKEGYRLAKECPDVYLISLKDGSRKCIKNGLEFTFNRPGISPGGRYVWWYDLRERTFFTYELASGTVRNVGKGVATSLCDEEWDRAADPIVYGLGGWIDGDAGMLVYDRYDIWKLDPGGIAKPVNITKGFGRSNKIRLRVVAYNVPFFQVRPPIKSEERPLVAALDEMTKANGFYRISLDGRKNPEKEILHVGKFYYYPEIINFVSFPYTILKARNADVFLIKRMSAAEFPNLYVTKDFRRFEAISLLAPERQYNWLTSELIRWKTFKGRDGEAILYKPTDFDSCKRYPVIFYCYERQTPGLNLYEDPDYSSGAVNIPWFVSRGYVVVCPDLRYQVGDPGKGIYDYMVSGVEYIKTKHWVATDRIGLEGHSWGGFEVNYLVTTTNVFRCAIAASGASNMSSLYGLEGFSACSGPSFVEQASYRMGGILTDSISRYVDNSPVFKASKVETPLLLLSNDKDDNVPWEQGVEMFTVLRRMGKKVWLLEYPDAAHSLAGENARDFTRRVTAYFDYYLRGEGSPEWMNP